MGIILIVVIVLIFIGIKRNKTSNSSGNSKSTIPSKSSGERNVCSTEKGKPKKTHASPTSEAWASIDRTSERIDLQCSLYEMEDAQIEVSDTLAKKVAISKLNEITYSNITKKTPRDKLGDFVVIDTETTGLKPSSAEIIDIAAIRFRGFKPVSKFSTLLAPQKQIPPEATKINGITNEMVAGKPCFQQVAASLVDFIGKDNIVGHNLPFDLSFIVKYGADVTLEKRKYYDTLAIARRTVKKAKEKWDKDLEEYVTDLDSDGIENYKLGTLCSWYGIQNTNSHRAEGDALATGQLLKKLADDRA